MLTVEVLKYEKNQNKPTSVCITVDNSDASKRFVCVFVCLRACVRVCVCVFLANVLLLLLLLLCLAIRRMMERAYRVTPPSVRPSVSVRVRDGVSNLRLSFSDFSNLR